MRTILIFPNGDKHYQLVPRGNEITITHVVSGYHAAVKRCRRCIAWAKDVNGNLQPTIHVTNKEAIGLRAQLSM